MLIKKNVNKTIAPQIYTATWDSVICIKNWPGIEREEGLSKKTVWSKQFCGVLILSDVTFELYPNARTAPLTIPVGNAKKTVDCTSAALSAEMVFVQLKSGSTTRNTYNIIWKTLRKTV